MLLRFLLAWVGVIGFVWHANADDSVARDTVVAVVDAFKTEIVEKKAVLKQDEVALRKAVREVISPVIDFADLSKKVMGKYYLRATDEQRERFAVVTEQTLLKTYGASMLDFDPSKINVLPEVRPNRNDTVWVDTEFYTDAGAAVNVAFLMEQIEGRWWLSNVVINNINFGLTFRKQFGLMVQKSRNDLDEAITAWEASLAQGQ